MDLYAFNHEVDRLEALLPRSAGMARLDVLVALAWHLRQRDSRRALDLASAVDDRPKLMEWTHPS